MHTTQDFISYLKETPTLTKEDALRILNDTHLDVLDLVHLAYQQRKTYFGKEVMVHVLNNAQNGYCPEDCGYCAQSKPSKANIAEYPLKSDEEILKEAEKAYQNGSFRYCMVSSGRGPSKKRVTDLSRIIQKIKQTYPMQVCLSAGLIDEPAAQELKQAGLDRLNHNLNTSKNFYPNICTTHTYQDRLNTLMHAKKFGLEICSGIIVGMGETDEDIVEVAFQLKELDAPSVPVNFLVPIEGNPIKTPKNLSPQKALRVLCMFRLVLPKAEIRAAAGREGHLRDLQVLALYVANSLFLEGYLNTQGGQTGKLYQLIQDSGFIIKNPDPEKSNPAEFTSTFQTEGFQIEGSKDYLKSEKDLRPFIVKVTK